MSNNNSARSKLANGEPVMIEDKDTGLITFHKWVPDYYTPLQHHFTFFLHSSTNKGFKRAMKTVASKEVLHHLCGDVISKHYFEMHRVGKEIIVSLATGTKVRFFLMCAFCIVLWCVYATAKNQIRIDNKGHEGIAMCIRVRVSRGCLCRCHRINKHVCFWYCYAIINPVTPLFKLLCHY